MQKIANFPKFCAKNSVSKRSSSLWDSALLRLPKAQMAKKMKKRITNYLPQNIHQRSGFIKIKWKNFA